MNPYYHPPFFEATALHLHSMEEDGEPIPTPTPISKLKLKKNEIASPIEVWMPYYQSQIKTVYVKKTLTIQSWLDNMAKVKNINFSQTLQDALKEKLGIHDRH